MVISNIGNWDPGPPPVLTVQTIGALSSTYFTFNSCNFTDNIHSLLKPINQNTSTVGNDNHLLI